MKTQKRIRVAGICLALAVGVMSLAGCGQKASVNQLAEQPEEGQQIATIHVKDYGDIKIMLFPEVAPKAVENFTTHAENGYYDGVKFHRVIADFMAQTGDPNGDGTGGESIWGTGFGIEVDKSLRHYTGAVACAQTSQPNSIGSQFYLVDAPSPGTVEEMKEANASYQEQVEALKKQYPDQADAIDEMYGTLPYPTDEEVLKNYAELGGAPWLDDQYTVFGQIYEGLDVLDQIMNAPRDPSIVDDSGNTYVPSPDIIIETITVGVYEAE